MIIAYVVMYYIIPKKLQLIGTYCTTQKQALLPMYTPINWNIALNHVSS